VTGERPLTRKGQATRDRIVSAATDLIAQHGVAGLSTDQVRKAAGVSGSQLYHYFASKGELIRAVITRQADLAVGGVPDLGALDSLDALRAWADAAVARQAEDAGRGECTLGTLAAELSADEPSRAEISEGFLRWRDVLRAGLGRMQDRGDLDASADLDGLAYALLAALQGGALLSQTLRDVAPMRAALDAALCHVEAHTG
jgi:TetR/AcrR family transcriptional regulator, transcriptional repressor for nem operon